jgi:hypothetical protein
MLCIHVERKIMKGTIMRKKVFRITMSLLVVVFILSMAIYTSAQTAEQLLKTPGLSPAQRAAIAEAIAKQGSPESMIPTSLKGMLEWKEMGEAFATTIESICRTLSVEVNDFLKSDVGMLTAALIVYKMVGQDIFRIILYTGIWLGVTFFMMISIKFLHMRKKVKQRLIDPSTEGEGKTAKYVITTVYLDRFGWPGGDDDGPLWRMASLFVHIIAWFIFSCIIAYSVI